MYGASYFMDEQVILVTLNYRLAGLGKNNKSNGNLDRNVQKIIADLVGKSSMSKKFDLNESTVTHLHLQIRFD